MCSHNTEQSNTNAPASLWADLQVNKCVIVAMNVCDLLFAKVYYLAPRVIIQVSVNAHDIMRLNRSENVHGGVEYSTHGVVR